MLSECYCVLVMQLLLLLWLVRVQYLEESGAVDDCIHRAARAIE